MNTLTLVLMSVALSPAAAQGQASARNAVLLDFTASWCGPCQQMNPIVSRLQREGHPVRKVDIDQERELANRFKITSIPAFVLVVNGQEVDRIVGATSEAQLKQMLAKVPQAQADGVATDSRAAAPSGGGQPATGRVHRGVQIPFFGRQQDDDEPIAAADATIRAQNGEQPPAAAASPMSSSIRIRVKDKGSLNYGSGTIIDSQPGRTVIVTCGHVFRGLSKEAVIEVDVFQGGQAAKYVGRVLRYDLEAEVGLLAIATDGPLPVAKIAPLERSVREGDAVLSIGCGGGELPSEQKLRVTALNRYLGPDNIECTGTPVPGRSGGGLFNAAGEVVGVCFAVEPRDKRGLYAGLKPIHDLLTQSELAHLCRPAGPSQPTPDARPRSIELAETGQRRPAEPVAFPLDDPAPHGREDEDDILWGGPEETPVSAELPGRSIAPREELDPSRIADIQSALEQVGEAEVVCVIRPLDDPQGASRVVIINRASSKFLSYLNGELRDQPQHTTATVRTADPDPAPAADPNEPQRYIRSAASRAK